MRYRLVIFVASVLSAFAATGFVIAGGELKQCAPQGRRAISAVNVDSGSALESALGSAHAGDTIELAPGTYSGVSISNLNVAGGTVTITSANASNPASITDLQVNSSSGLSFSGLVFNTDPSVAPASASALTPIAVNSSNNISFSNSSFHGSLDGNPLDDNGYGLKIASSTNVSVTNSEFQQLEYGIVTDDASTHLTFTGNDFHDIHLGGIASNASFVTITGNYFHDFDPQAGDHPDAIHFWNQTATDAPHNVTVDNNVVMVGSGNPIQGIFFELPAASSVPFSNITIDNNFLIGTMYNAISLTTGNVSASTGIVIENNTIASTNANMVDRILLGNTTGAIEENNQAATFIFGPGGNPSFTPSNTNANLTYTNDTTTPIVTDGGQAMLQQYLAANPGFSLSGPLARPSLSNTGSAATFSAGGSAADIRAIAKLRSAAGSHGFAPTANSAEARDSAGPVGPPH